MERSQEYYEQRAYVRLADIYKNIVYGSVKEKHGLVICPFCDATAAFKENGYQCINSACPLCMMEIPLIQHSYNVPVVEQPDQPEVKQEPQPAPAPAPEPEKPYVSCAEAKTMRYVGGISPMEKPQLKKFAEIADQKFRDAFVKAKTGAPFVKNLARCPYCESQLQTNGGKKNHFPNVRRRSYKCTNNECPICTQDIVCHVFYNTITKIDEHHPEEMPSIENIELALNMKVKPISAPAQEEKAEPAGNAWHHAIGAPPPEIAFEEEPAPEPKRLDFVEEDQVEEQAPEPDQEPEQEPEPEPEHVRGRPMRLQFIKYNKTLNTKQRNKARKAVKLLSAVHSEKIQPKLDRISHKEGVSTYDALRLYIKERYPSIHKKVW